MDRFARMIKALFDMQVALIDPNLEALFSVGQEKGIAEAETVIKNFAVFSLKQSDFVKVLWNGAFVGATVVLLGGFATALLPIDFWTVSAILATQFIRQRSGVTANFDERQRQRALEVLDLVAAIDDDLRPSKSTLISRLTSEWRQFLRIRDRSFIFPSTISLCCAMGSTSLAITRLIQRNFGSKIMESDNGSTALLLFYIVALMEGILYLLPLDSTTFMSDEMKRLCEIFGLEESWGVQVLFAIFYNMRGSIRREIPRGTPIESLKIEVLPFALDLFTKEVQQNCHFGVLILSSLARGKGDLGRIMRTETLDAIISKPELVDRLLATVSSREPNMEHFRLAAAQILRELCSVSEFLQSMTDNEPFSSAIHTLFEDLTDFRPSSSGKKRAQKRRSFVQPKLKEIGSAILNPPSPTLSASSSNAPPPVDVSGFPPKQQQYYRDLALQNQQQRDMIRTLQQEVENLKSSY